MLEARHPSGDMTRRSTDLELSPAAATGARSHSASSVTSPAHWDNYWRHRGALPVEMMLGADTVTTSILTVLDRWADAGERLSVAEIGGAPGGWLVHLWRRFGHQITVIDSSPVGVEMTRRNFDLLGVPGSVLQRDIFSVDPPIPQFDLAYSLGVIEHFADVTAVVAAHLNYVKPGGRLIIGCPNFLGLNGAILRRLRPSLFDWHNCGAMDLRTWPDFERTLALRVLYRAYIAGIQPSAWKNCEQPGLRYRAVARGFGKVAMHWDGRLGRAASRLNSRYWSYYAMGVYDKAPLA